MPATEPVRLNGPAQAVLRAARAQPRGAPEGMIYDAVGGSRGEFKELLGRLESAGYLARRGDRWHAAQA